MNRSKFFSITMLLSIFALILVANPMEVQAQDDKSLYDRFNDYWSGESDDAKVFMNKRSGKQVKVAVAELSFQDKLFLQSTSSAYNAFKGTEDLEVEDLAFAPDFNEGLFYLTFATDTDDDTRIVVLDVKGNEIHNETIEEFTGTYDTALNINADQSGTYFLKIIQGFSLMNKKLVVE